MWQFYGVIRREHWPKHCKEVTYLLAKPLIHKITIWWDNQLPPGLPPILSPPNILQNIFQAEISSPCFQQGGESLTMQCLCAQVPGTWHSPRVECHQTITSRQHSESFHRFHVSQVALPGFPHFEALLFNPVPKVIESPMKWVHISKTKNRSCSLTLSGMLRSHLASMKSFTIAGKFCSTAMCVADAFCCGKKILRLGKA